MKTMLMMLALVCAAGCMNIDYVGRKFSPTEDIRYCESREKIDFDRYTLIGRFTVTTTTRKHLYDVEDAVLEKAGEYGGNLLCPAGYAVVNHGAYTPNDREFGAPWPENSKTPEAEKERFGAPAALSGNPFHAKRQEFRFLLYKETAEVNRQLGL